MLETLAAQGGRGAGALPVLVLLIATEFLWLRLRGRPAYDLKETLASTVIAAGNRIVRLATAALLLPLFTFVHDHRLFELSIGSIGAFALLLVAVDFGYYWMHRAMHRVRWLWASHSVHHSSTRLNLSAAYRLSWTDFVSGSWLFLLPYIWLGVEPLAVAAAFGFNLLFQFFLHTEAVRSLGPLEWLLNTPAHHRVHHAHNEGCVDRNFGGVLIVWDRCFGSFARAPADQALRYGLIGVAASHNPLKIAFGEWRRLLRDMFSARSLGGALKTAAGRP